MTLEMTLIQDFKREKPERDRKDYTKSNFNIIFLDY